MHVWKSLREYVLEVATAWFAWAIAILTGAVDAAKEIFPSFQVPRFALIAGYVAALLLAQFKAFHRARVSRDERVPAGAGAPGVPGALAPPDSPGLPALELPELDGGDRLQPREVLARLGMANSLVGRFQISNFAPPLDYDQQGTVIRVILGGNQPPLDARLGGEIKRELQAAVAVSSFESWLVAEALDGELGREPRPVWKRASPNTGYATTLKRATVPSVLEGSCLSAKCTFQLPVGPTSGPYLVLIIDLVEQAVATEEDGQGTQRLRFTLDSLHSLLHVLAKTAVDEVAARVFPLIFGEEPELVGPNFEINFGDRTLTDVLKLPSHFHRPDDVTSSSPWAYINTPEGSNARDVIARDTIIRDGIVAMLQQNEFDDVEEEIAALSTPTAAPSPLEEPNHGGGSGRVGHDGARGEEGGPSGVVLTRPDARGDAIQRDALVVRGERLCKQIAYGNEVERWFQDVLNFMYGIGVGECYVFGPAPTQPWSEIVSAINANITALRSIQILTGTVEA